MLSCTLLCLCLFLVRFLPPLLFSHHSLISSVWALLMTVCLHRLFLQTENCAFLSFFSNACEFPIFNAASSQALLMLLNHQRCPSLHTHWNALFSSMSQHWSAHAPSSAASESKLHQFHFSITHSQLLHSLFLSFKHTPHSFSALPYVSQTLPLPLH